MLTHISTHTQCTPYVVRGPHSSYYPPVSPLLSPPQILATLHMQAASPAADFVNPCKTRNWSRTYTSLIRRVFLSVRIWLEKTVLVTEGHTFKSVS
jgi:hypothetical protein